MRTKIIRSSMTNNYTVARTTLRNFFRNYIASILYILLNNYKWKVAINYSFSSFDMLKSFVLLDKQILFFSFYKYHIQRKKNIILNLNFCSDNGDSKKITLSHVHFDYKFMVTHSKELPVLEIAKTSRSKGFILRKRVRNQIVA